MLLESGTDDFGAAPLLGLSKRRRFSRRGVGGREEAGAEDGERRPREDAPASAVAQALSEISLDEDAERWCVSEEA